MRTTVSTLEEALLIQSPSLVMKVQNLPRIDSARVQGVRLQTGERSIIWFNCSVKGTNSLTNIEIVLAVKADTNHLE